MGAHLLGPGQAAHFWGLEKEEEEEEEGTWGIFRTDLGGGAEGPKRGGKEWEDDGRKKESFRGLRRRVMGWAPAF